MISRTLLISTNKIENNIVEYFATLLNIQNYFSFEESNYEDINQSFHDKREAWFSYEKLVGDFNYILEIGMYLNYSDFLLLLKKVSAYGFKIAIPDETSISPFVYDLLDNKKFIKVLIFEEEEEKKNDIMAYNIVYDATLNNYVIFDKDNLFWNVMVSLFLYWSFTKNILTDTLQKFIEKQNINSSLLSSKNLLVIINQNILSKEIFSNYFNNKGKEFVQFYIYFSKKWFFDIIKNTLGINVFSSYLNDLVQRNIAGIDYVEVWLDFNNKINYNVNINEFHKLLEVFDKTYQIYLEKETLTFQDLHSFSPDKSSKLRKINVR